MMDKDPASEPEPLVDSMQAGKERATVPEAEAKRRIAELAIQLLQIQRETSMDHGEYRLRLAVNKLTDVTAEMLKLMGEMLKQMESENSKAK